MDQEQQDHKWRRHEDPIAWLHPEDSRDHLCEACAIASFGSTDQLAPVTEWTDWYIDTAVHVLICAGCGSELCRYSDDPPDEAELPKDSPCLCGAPTHQGQCTVTDCVCT